MQTHRHLLLFEPNLIIQLLQICINHNYFQFTNLIFQQIQGTAMGTTFSPSLANIFMSAFLRRFLHDQPYPPMLIKRYIDDLYMLLQHGGASLNTFIDELNQFHPNIHFKYTFSDREVSFLDLSIYKGACFTTTHRLDTTTFQKPQNLYQYLHFTSNHPKQMFKAIITGELMRYVRTNTTEEGFHSMSTLFKERLLKRGYPINLVQKTIRTVSYQSRTHLLTLCLKNPPRIKAPIFKCVTPPNFGLLKEIVLKDYQTLRIPIQNLSLLDIQH